MTDTITSTQVARQLGTGFGLRTSAKPVWEESGAAINRSESFTPCTLSGLPSRKDIEGVAMAKSTISLSDAQKIDAFDFACVAIVSMGLICGAIRYSGQIGGD